MSSATVGLRFQGSLGKTWPPKETGTLLIPLDIAAESPLQCSHTGGDVWCLPAADPAAAAAAAAGPAIKCNTWDSRGRNPSMNVYVHLQPPTGSSNSGGSDTAAGASSCGAAGSVDEAPPRCKLGILIQHALPSMAVRLGGYAQLELDWVTWAADGDAGGAPLASSVAPFGTLGTQHWEQLHELAMEKEKGAGAGNRDCHLTTDAAALRRAKETLVEAATYFGAEVVAKVSRLTVRKLYQREYHFYDADKDVADSRRHALEWAAGLAEVEELLATNLEARAKLNERLTGPGTAGGAANGAQAKKRIRPPSTGAGTGRRVLLTAGGSSPLGRAVSLAGMLGRAPPAAAAAAAAPAASHVQSTAGARVPQLPAISGFDSQQLFSALWQPVAGQQQGLLPLLQPPQLQGGPSSLSLSLLQLGLPLEQQQVQQALGGQLLPAMQHQTPQQQQVQQQVQQQQVQQAQPPAQQAQQQQAAASFSLGGITELLGQLQGTASWLRADSALPPLPAAQAVCSSHSGSPSVEVTQPSPARTDSPAHRDLSPGQQQQVQAQAQQVQAQAQQVQQLPQVGLQQSLLQPRAFEAQPPRQPQETLSRVQAADAGRLHPQPGRMEVLPAKRPRLQLAQLPLLPAPAAQQSAAAAAEVDPLDSALEAWEAHDKAQRQLSLANRQMEMQRQQVAQLERQREELRCQLAAAQSQLAQGQAASGAAADAAGGSPAPSSPPAAEGASAVAAAAAVAAAGAASTAAGAAAAATGSLEAAVAAAAVQVQSAALRELLPSRVRAQLTELLQQRAELAPHATAVCDLAALALEQVLRAATPNLHNKPTAV